MNMPLDYHESMRLSMKYVPASTSLGAKESVHQQYFDYQDDEEGGRRAFGDLADVPVGVERTDACEPRIHEVQRSYGAPAQCAQHRGRHNRPTGNPGGHMTDDSHRLVLEMMPERAHEGHDHGDDRRDSQRVMVQKCIHWRSSWAAGQYSRNGQAWHCGARA